MLLDPQVFQSQQHGTQCPILLKEGHVETQVRVLIPVPSGVEKKETGSGNRSRLYSKGWRWDEGELGIAWERMCIWYGRVSPTLGAMRRSLSGDEVTQRQTVNCEICIWKQVQPDATITDQSRSEA